MEAARKFRRIDSYWLVFASLVLLALPLPVLEPWRWGGVWTAITGASEGIIVGVVLIFASLAPTDSHRD